MLHRLGKKRKKEQAGFTLIEVLAGMVMATVFVLITTQAIALSALFRVRAQRESEAVNWIQEDLENIKFAALFAPADENACDATTQATGYGQSLKAYVESANFIDEFSPDPDDDGDGDPTTREMLNKPYEMERALDVYNFAPYSLLTASYSVVDPDSGLVIADLYTEVIPDAAFDCD
ncbi:MAG: type II secretion system protein [Limnothrix sp.]